MRRSVPADIRERLRAFCAHQAGLVLVIAMVTLPFLASLVGIGRAPSGVPEGLRGATHRPELPGKVSFAFSSTAVVALLAPPGIPPLVTCGVGFMGDRPRVLPGEDE